MKGVRRSAQEAIERPEPQRAAEPAAPAAPAWLLGLQQSAGNAAVTSLVQGYLARQPAPGPTLPPAVDVSVLPDAVRAVLNRSLTETDSWDFNTALADAVLGALGNALAADAREHVRMRIDLISGLSQDAAGTAYDIPSGLRALERIHRSAGGISGVAGSRGLGLLMSVFTRDIADSLAGATSGPAQTGATPKDDPSCGMPPSATVSSDLEQLAAAIAEPHALMKLELEGTVDRLSQRRMDFAVATDQPSRAEIGKDIGALSRQALLLNQALAELKPGAPGAATPLDAEIARVAGRIAASRELATTERATQTQLGDSPELLAVQDVAIPDPAFLDTPEASVNPEQAFPEATDAASTMFMDQLAGRISAQAGEVKRLRGGVIPDSPTYTLAEFTKVYRHYYAFVSHEQEAMNPLYKFAMDMMGDTYKQLGSGLFKGVGAVEGGIARAMVLHMVSKLLTGAMGGPQPDFAQDLGAGAKRVAPPVSGTASSPTYAYAELYQTKGGGGAPATPAGERSSRIAYGNERQADTASAFSGVARMPGFMQPDGGRGEGDPADRAAASGPATGPGAGGLELPDRRPGPDGPRERHDRQARAQGDVAEVAQYLLARRQQAATLAARHHPKTAGGKDIGDIDIRLGGVEQGTASSVATYVRGEANPALPRAARNVRSAVEHAHASSGLRDPGGADASQQVTMALVGDLERYFAEFYKQRQDNAWRFGAVLIIGNIEWGLGAKLAALTNPDTIRKMIQEALRISLTIALLNRMGPLGILAGARTRCTSPRRASTTSPASSASRRSASMRRTPPTTCRRRARGRTSRATSPTTSRSCSRTSSPRPSPPGCSTSRRARRSR